MGNAWRYRECPFCHHVAEASAFTFTGHGAYWLNGNAVRQCPKCNVTSHTSSFRLVPKPSTADAARKTAKRGQAAKAPTAREPADKPPWWVR